MNNEEKKVQDKINAKKVQGAKTKTEKDWQINEIRASNDFNYKDKDLERSM